MTCSKHAMQNEPGINKLPKIYISLERAPNFIKPRSSIELGDSSTKAIIKRHSLSLKQVCSTSTNRNEKDAHFQYPSLFWPGYPAEKFVMRGGGSLATPSKVFCPSRRRCSEIKSIRGTPLLSAWPTLLLPGSFPTRTKSVFPDTAEVTRPPKDSIMPVVRSLPSTNPLPPPISGNTPVKTKRLPSNTPAIPPLTPGRGTLNLVFLST
mmetsp:Transcript_8791/g.16025  ORF Transcript_8791/g.16025 Transcript_8791/m.16025 type:complete len:208 (+) Transcript_8791:78-701(+)